MGNKASDCVKAFSWNTAPQVNTTLQLQHTIVGDECRLKMAWGLSFESLGCVSSESRPTAEISEFEHKTQKLGILCKF